jgi:hypothetical protein
MIPKAREVRLTPKIRKVLEARCRAPSTAQRDVKRTRIVLLAAEGRSTIAQARKLLNVPASQTQSSDTNAAKADEPPALRAALRPDRCVGANRHAGRDLMSRRPFRTL